MYEIFKRFGKNLHGRDFAGGDVHGCFTKLEEALAAVRFDKRRDRLFLAGDTVDRGPESDDAAYYLMQESWLESVKGNHEQMLIDALNPDYPDAAMNHARYGGLWFYGLSSVEQKCIAAILGDLPLAIEVETDRGIVGIVHAEVPMYDWDLFKSMYAANKDRFDEIALWTWKPPTQRVPREVKGVHHVYVGHARVVEPLTLSNVTYLDTGSGFPGGKITLVQIN